MDIQCSRCFKSPELCICSQITPLQNQIHVLILQHPQEPDQELGSARIAHLAMPNSTLKIGLSWANLSAALGKQVTPSRWGVLYLGSGIKGKPSSPVQFVSKQGTPIDPPPETLEGIVVLDGTWSQAKALWWRNAWLLKLRRMVLTPTHKSLYGELRKEPRRECLSTIETIAEALVGLGESPQLREQLKGLFSALLNKHRERLKSSRK
jgi:DTW domain-containing protein YfiP